MCGIVGIISNKGVNKSIIYSMTDLLMHRGPDQKNHWNNIDDTVYFGHTRLSILDLTMNGLQPMISSTGRFVITYNGEIYNHLILRKTIKYNQWKSTTDTETILQLVEEFGIKKTLDSLEGMFSFAIWDNLNEELTLARDRIGEKPLYYGFINDSFVFSSELNPIKKNFKDSLYLDDEAIHYFLKKGYIPQPLSIFKNIKKLESGNYLKLNKNKILDFYTKKYYDLNNLTNHVDESDKNFNYFKKTTFNLLDSSVKKQMLSDAPLGAFLSSGIDSSIITALMQKNSIDKINTFTIGFENKTYNESLISKKISNYLGTNHEELIFSNKDLLNIVPKITQVYDEPFADSSQIPSILLSSLASRSVKVCLTGDGADELFGGYQRYKVVSNFIKMSLIVKIPILIIFKILKKKSLFQILNFINKLNPYFFSFPIQKQKIDKLYALFSNKNNNPYESLMSNFIDHKNLSLPPENETLKNLYVNASDPKQFMLIDLLDYLPNDILCKVDRASMHYSLETRAPFLDHHVVNFSQIIPEKYKLSNLGNKLILRSIQKELIPEELCNTKKIGFGIPLNFWLKNDLKEWVEDTIHNTSTKNQNILNNRVVSEKWSDFKKGNEELGISIWYICVLQSWLNDFFSS